VIVDRSYPGRCPSTSSSPASRSTAFFGWIRGHSDTNVFETGILLTRYTLSWRCTGCKNATTAKWFNRRCLSREYLAPAGLFVHRVRSGGKSGQRPTIRVLVLLNEMTNIVFRRHDYEVRAEGKQDHRHWSIYRPVRTVPALVCSYKRQPQTTFCRGCHRKRGSRPDYRTSSQDVTHLCLLSPASRQGGKDDRRVHSVSTEYNRNLKERRQPSSILDLLVFVKY